MLYSFLIVGVAICLCDLICERLGMPRVPSYMLSLVLVAILQPCSFLFFAESPVDFVQLVIVTGVGLMLWFVYLNIVQAINSSLRIRVLLEMSAHGNAISVPELVDKYNDHELTIVRLNRLIEGGAIEQRSGKYYLRSRNLVKAARFFSFLKLLVLGKTSQFE